MKNYALILIISALIAGVPYTGTQSLGDQCSLSRSHANDLSAANACMNQAKAEQMSWVEGLGSLNSLAPESALVLSNVIRDTLRRELGR
jgi:hypothetical protein